MRHTLVEQWSRGSSPLHRLDPGAKLLPIGVSLVVLATAHRGLPIFAAAMAALIGAGIVIAHLPVGAVLARAGVVLPFTGVFAVISWLGGDSARAIELVLKSYLSALLVLLLVATTPLTSLFHRLELIGVPGFLLTVIHFLYRYLFVVAQEASNMRTAASARGGLTFQAAAGVLAVLFARSYVRAGQIHRAMLARGFSGRFHPPGSERFAARDAVFAACATAVPIVLRLAIRGLV